jgi:hypothetical protein
VDECFEPQNIISHLTQKSGIPWVSLPLQQPDGWIKIESFQRAQQEIIFKNFPEPVVATLTPDVATALAQKQTVGCLTLTDTEELIEENIDACWEAIR